MKKLIWTEAYTPFIMGGNVNAPICTEVEVGDPVEIGRGMFAYVVASPINGCIYVAESTTGAFVGSSIEEVRKDVESADVHVIKKQLKEASERVKQARHLSTEHFWSKFK